MDPVTGQSQLDDGYFEIETKPQRIIRKKVSLDLDVTLHKRLKHIALENDVKLYELVESVLRDYVKRKSKVEGFMENLKREFITTAEAILLVGTFLCGCMWDVNL